MNVTATFMRFCLHAWHKDYHLAWAIRRTAEELAPDTMDPFAFVCGRPKTPDRHAKAYARRWLARFFRPVSDALLDGASDDEALRIWRHTDRKDTGRDQRRKAYDAFPQDRVVIRARELDRRNWHYVK